MFPILRIWHEVVSSRSSSDLIRSITRGRQMTEITRTRASHGVCQEKTDTPLHVGGREKTAGCKQVPLKSITFRLALEPRSVPLSPMQDPSLSLLASVEKLPYLWLLRLLAQSIVLVKYTHSNSRSRIPSPRNPTYLTVRTLALLHHRDAIHPTHL